MLQCICRIACLSPTAIRMYLILIFTLFRQIIMAAYEIGQAIIFSSMVSAIFFFLLFPRLISAVADWMSTILPHTVWP